RRGGRVAEGARLESVFTGNRNVGSNPTPSATPERNLGPGRRPPEVRYHAADGSLAPETTQRPAPIAGPIALEYSAFAVDRRPDLRMVICNPATSWDADRFSSLIKSQTCASASIP